MHTEWKDNKVLLVNGESSDEYRNKLIVHRYIVTKEAIEQSSDGEPEYSEWLKDEYGFVSHNEQPLDTTYFRDPIGYHWLCIYPNRQTSGVIPVLVTTNAGNTGGAGNYSYITPLTERTLTHLSDRGLISGGSIGEKIMKHLEIETDNDEPYLKAEWRRTALFIENHPLYKKWKRMQTTEAHIKKWREELLK